MDMYGWTGRILRVDLTSQSCSFEKLSDSLLHDFLGGRGIGVKLMEDFYGLNPYSPDIPLIFAVGSLAGTGALSSSKVSVISRSPLTNTIFDASAGGSFSVDMKRAGIDAIFITGESKKPVLISVSQDKAELIDAAGLWGENISSTFDSLSQNGSVAAIGTAGENGVSFSTIGFSGGNVTDRGSLGAIMGKKRLKAIVVKGSKTPKIADKSLFKEANQNILRLFKASPVISGEFGISKYGTAAFVDLIQQRRMVPTENFNKTVFNDLANYSAVAIKKAFSGVMTGCPYCPIQCKRATKSVGIIPEYDAISHFGALNGIFTLSDIIDANHICYETGMDSISVAATIAAWGEARGSFVASGELREVLESIAMRKGIWELLAFGSKRAMEHMGKPELSMTVKGLELPAYDPRGAYGVALGYVTSSRGGCHLRACSFSHEILRKPVATDRFSFDGKARMVKIAEDSHAALDSMVVCKNAMFGATLEEYATLLTAVTGEDYTAQRLKEIGENIYRLERFYNYSNGFTEEDDKLPDRFFEQPGSCSDGVTISPIDRERFEEELRKYYAIRGLPL